MSKFTVGLEDEHVFNVGCDTFEEVMTALASFNADAWWSRCLGVAYVRHDETLDTFSLDGTLWPYGTRDKDESLRLAYKDVHMVEDLKKFISEHS